MSAQPGGEQYDFTTTMLFGLCQLGAHVPVLEYGLNVVYDLIRYASEVAGAAVQDDTPPAEIITLDMLRAQAQARKDD